MQREARPAFHCSFLIVRFSFFICFRLLRLKYGPAQRVFDAGLVEAGSLKPRIDRTFPLIEGADAVRYLAEGHPNGKIVVTV